ncbi:MAG: decaprenyl-phosphate phosphoribosyltransferase [Patescibacteria group bacterium]|nr:decaprenyl-phosphate phosphoribosyltransferase [Patescibacteria group bacterium]
MKKKLYNIIRLLRPRQWIKNFAIFPAILFTGQLFEILVLQKIIIGFFAFCFLSSAIYIVNDIFDAKKDKLHPFKKYRPIAHGDVSIPVGLILAMALGIFAFLISYSVTPAFFILIIVYAILQIAYSMFLKNIALIDILALAAGYILRVYGGEFASGFHISVWLLLTTISASLFIAVGKRRSELALISRHLETKTYSTRQALSHYSEKLLDLYLSVFATSSFISYSLFTFLENPQGFKISFGLFSPDFLPAFFQRKWLMVTIIPVVYGIMRYVQVLYEKQEGENPERILIEDKQLLTTVIIWLFLVIGVIYVIGA